MARILIVDDHSPARSLIRAIAQLDRHEVAEAADGEQALEMLTRDPFDLVILDLVMPKVDGYEVLEQLRAMPGREDTPVLVVSAADESVDLLRTAELGALDHLSKPFGYDEMARAMRRVLSATPEELAAMRGHRTMQLDAYHTMIDLAPKEPVRRGLFRRARASRR
ncbi:MAG: response regulator [Actinomycetota bacterium]